jgi:hypothetical protein
VTELAVENIEEEDFEEITTTRANKLWKLPVIFGMP